MDIPSNMVIHSYSDRIGMGYMYVHLQKFDRGGMGYICTYTDKSWVFLETWSSIDTQIEGAWVICVHL